MNVKTFIAVLIGRYLPTLAVHSVMIHEALLHHLICLHNESFSLTKISTKTLLDPSCTV